MRYFADIFDADGKAYIFDDAKGGAEVCGPFDTLENAEQAANDLNTDYDEPHCSRKGCAHKGSCGYGAP